MAWTDFDNYLSSGHISSCMTVFPLIARIFSGEQYLPVVQLLVKWEIFSNWLIFGHFRTFVNWRVISVCQFARFSRFLPNSKYFSGWQMNTDIYSQNLQALNNWSTDLQWWCWRRADDIGVESWWRKTGESWCLPTLADLSESRLVSN